MPSVLLAWIGNTDLAASAGDPKAGLGPIAQALAARSFDEIVLLTNHPKADVKRYLTWLKPKTQAALAPRFETLPHPSAYEEILHAATAAVDDVQARHGRDVSLTFHLSPGTPAMASIWLLLGKARYRAELIDSSPQRGVRTVDLPFEIGVDWPEDTIVRLASGTAPETAEFGTIVAKSPAMKALLARAARVAVTGASVLIQGETGTGKELLARAIHGHGPRGRKPFVPVNCGAIPESLIESEFFGYEQGAFTGANRARAGYFESAHGGTLFLDEVGELPLAAQVRLLRVLQQKEVTRLGSNTPKPIDFRIIAATHRDLARDVAEGRFREDLFYRLAVATLRLPPLRDRGVDLRLLIEHLLARILKEGPGTPSAKELTTAARSALLSHDWPGNVRELENTLLRAVLWSEGTSISAEDVRAALLSIPRAEGSDVMSRQLGPGFKLRELMDDVARTYLERAIVKAEGNKSYAADLVGLPNYQTFTNWLNKYGVAAPTTRRRRSKSP